MIEIKTNISLKPYNTFGIDVKAKQFCSITNETDLQTILKKHKQQPLFILSGGSNMLLTKDIEALVVHINTKGITIEKKGNCAIVTAKAGENWHNFVQFCIKNNLGGIENLSLIPGCVGSSPIQNIGAYGVEIKDTFINCKALNIETLEFESFSNEQCQFGYRDSVFKKKAKGKYVIVEVTFKLTTQEHQLKTAYGAIQEELKKCGISSPSIKDVSNAVTAIRKTKLPDPHITGNSGSFFKNPIISITQFKDLEIKFPSIPHYTVSETQVKIPAGWLIDKANFKGFVYKNAAVHDKQALVLINKTGNASGTEILELSKLIKNKIKEIYQIELETEVNIF